MRFLESAPPESYILRASNNADICVGGWHGVKKVYCICGGIY